MEKLIVNKIFNEKEGAWRQLCSSCLIFLHFTVSIILFSGVWKLFCCDERIFGMSWWGRDGIVLLVYMAVLYFLNQTYNAYLLGYCQVTRLIFSEFLAQILAVSFIYAVVCIICCQLKSVLPFILLLIIQLCFDIAWAYGATSFYLFIQPVRRCYLVYRNIQDRERLLSFKSSPVGKLYQIVNEIQYSGNDFSEIQVCLIGAEALFIAGIDSKCTNGLIKYCKEKAIPGFLLPHIGDVILRSAYHLPSLSLPVFYMGEEIMHPGYRCIKRIFDFTASLLGIILLGPLMGVVAVVIRLYDGGPAIYRQTRLTRGGREFKIWKFRSMKVDAEKDGVARLSTGDCDPRITPIGRLVRKCRLDELPQLFNILFGDMSFVGPRPERPEIAEQYYSSLPEFRLRLQVKAGLTGYAQVFGKYNTDPYEKLEFDLMYINNMSLLTDLKLILATVAILFLPSSTEGIRTGQTTALVKDISKNDFQK